MCGTAAFIYDTSKLSDESTSYMQINRKREDMIG